MKKTLIALAAVAATSAFAQSSVTIDGVFDLGVRKLSSGVAAADTGMHLANSANNQIRFRGTEDLGGGLKANFVAAMRFDPTNGRTEGSATDNARALFQGEATIGLSGGFGSFKMGRSLTPAQGPLGAIGSPWATDTVASVALGGSYFTDPSANIVFQESGWQGRTDHIQYTTPNFGGFTGSIGYGFKQRLLNNDGVTSTTGGITSGAVTKADQDQKGLVSLTGTYAAGPLMVVLLHETNRGTFGTTTGSDKVTGLGGTYDFGVAKLYAGWITLDNAAFAAGVKEDSWALGVDVPMGAATFKAGYRSIDDFGGNVGRTAKKLGLGVYYALSKRTTLYTNYGSEKRSNETSRRKGFDLGVRHSF